MLGTAQIVEVIQTEIIQIGQIIIEVETLITRIREIILEETLHLVLQEITHFEQPLRDLLETQLEAQEPELGVFQELLQEGINDFKL